MNSTGIEIAVPSIMHSGTHLLRFLILRAYDKTAPDDVHYFNGTSGNVMHTFHLNHDFFPDNLVEKMRDLPTFTCLRHPYRMLQSYKKREQGHLDRTNHKISKYHLQWKRQMDIVDKYDPFYVCVDVPEVRDKQVQEMADFLDLPLKCEWRVNRRSGSVCGTHNYPIREDKDAKQEYIDFYNDKVEKYRG